MPSSTDMLLSLLNQTNELARKLSENLDPSRIEICRTIAREIISSTEKALCTANTLAFSNVGGLCLERLNPENRAKEHKMSKRRKILGNTTRQEIVYTDGVEVPPNDGHSWRKYGQKDILGAKHPRSYYRCTHRKSEGCLAIKQVQKSDENPSIFDITYLGTHTCFCSPHQATTTCFHNPQKNLLDEQNIFFLPSDFHFNLEVKTESSYFENQSPTTSFSFSSTPIEGINTETNLFCSSSNIECGYEETLPLEFMSPTRYGSNTYPLYELNSQEDSGQADLFSATNSLMDSPVIDLEFMLENGEMDTENVFDTSIFFN